MKRCTVCGEDKPDSGPELAFYSRGVDKLDSRCKECRRAETRANANRPDLRCRECATPLHRDATTDLCGFCAPEPPEIPPPVPATPPSRAENRARVAVEQASQDPMKER